mgnify:CR=1 FL=1|jgi:hypothetical protein
MPSPRQATSGLSPRGAFSVVYEGARNLLTPHVLGYRQATRGDRRLLVEHSYGAGMGDELHGVCFLEDTGDDSYTQRHDLNTCFHSRREADTYITATLDTFRND